ncbi:MAG: cupin domain-containing protein [Lachnospiraceae bacterium]
MNSCYFGSQPDMGPRPYVTNVPQKARQNTNYRSTLWTGCNAQMTLMCIMPGSDIGLENHKDTDQFVRVEQGMGLVKMGACEDRPEFQARVVMGDTIFVPAGTFHNVINIGKIPLKLSSVYAPPHHPAGTVHHTKKDSEKEDY